MSESVTFGDLLGRLCFAAVQTSQLYCIADALVEMEAGNDAEVARAWPFEAIHSQGPIDL